MTSISSLEDDFEHLSFPTQIDFCSNSPVNRALTHVAQEIAGLLQQSHTFQADSIKRVETISIRAIEPEYRHAMLMGCVAKN